MRTCNRKPGYINNFNKSILGSKVTMVLLFVLTLIAFPKNSSAQYILDNEVSFIYISGTSTLHEWTAIVEQMQGMLNGSVTADHIDKLEEVKITIPVTSLKSGKGAMDQNMYKALKFKKNPNISYALEDYSINEAVLDVKGELTIAGVTRPIKSKITYQKVGKHIKFYGTLNFTMSEFNIEPPEFLFGAFKTGDEVSLKFYFMFCNNN